MHRTAVLDGNYRLVGYRQTDRDSEFLIPVEDNCDLPEDGTYKWMKEEGCFMPLGHGFGKPKSAPVSSERVLYLITKTLIGRRANVPSEIKAWLDWYENNLKGADDERRERRKRGA